MSKTGTYLGGSTILGWSGAPRSAARKRRGGKGFLAREVEAHDPTLQRSEHMPPPGPAPFEARKPSTPKHVRKKKPRISREELDHFSFGERTREVMLDELEPLLRGYAKNGFRTPKDAARLLNNAGMKTACGERWTPQLAWFLQGFLFERREKRRADANKAATKPPIKRPSPLTPSGQAPLTNEELARRLSALGRIARSD